MRGNHIIFSSIVIFLLTASALASAVAPQQIRGSVIDPSLMRLITSPTQRGELEIIVQFTDGPTSQDLTLMGAYGLEVRYVFTAIPAVFATGTRDEVFRLSGYNRVFWMEHNSELEYHMDITTSVINATKVWQSKILNTDGSLNPSIDGTGVTVVVVDSGIDAGHPDLDYGSKTVLNLKSDSDMVWYEIENSDTSSGHGTHVAGTVAGNGDASAGGRRGVAPGANLIGISTGEGLWILNAIGGLEWAYENSKPGANPYNIRVVTNSWGSSESFDPNDAVVQLIEKLTYENNVVVTFSAGNEGADNHDGSDVTTNPYSLAPAAISVAASTHDGKRMAGFSSRGAEDDNFTWPDINAPGVSIWSTQPRRTLISAMTNDDQDLYYMAISGTSMSCPHVAGLVALLWQAAPSLRVSSVRDDFQEGGQFPQNEYWSMNNTRMHEAELILKLTSHYVSPGADTGIPMNHSRGLLNRSFDYAQGYGMVDAQAAVALALTLERLRVDNESATVLDALEVYRNVTCTKIETRHTSTLNTMWKGEWAQLLGSNGSNSYTSQQRLVYIPENANSLSIDLLYAAVKVDDEVRFGSVSLLIDANNDGQPEWSDASNPSTSGNKHYDIDLTGELASNRGKYWSFYVDGVGFQLLKLPQRPDPTKNEYREAMVDYTLDVNINLGEGDVNLTEIGYLARHAPLLFNEGSNTTTTNVSISALYFDLNNIYVEEVPELPEPVEEMPWLLIITAILLSVLAVSIYFRYAVWKKWGRGKAAASEKADEANG